MKIATLLLMAAALVAGHDGRDDWKQIPHNPPTNPAPEPATYALMAVGIGLIVAVARRQK